MLYRMSVHLEKRRFTVAEYYRMAEAGILTPQDRVELIDGEIVTMSPIGTRHNAAVDRAAQAIFFAVGRTAIVRVQGAIDLNEFTEPEPDIALLRPREDFYSASHPGAADVLLVIEISDSSLRYNRDVKTPLYATSGISEYWLVDLTTRTVTCHANAVENRYRDATAFRPGESLAPRALPGCVIAVDDLLVD
jgi:Uma2 family endonuclease